MARLHYAFLAALLLSLTAAKSMAAALDRQVVEEAKPPPSTTTLPIVRLALSVRLLDLKPGPNVSGLDGVGAGVIFDMTPADRAGFAIHLFLVSAGLDPLAQFGLDFGVGLRFFQHSYVGSGVSIDLYRQLTGDASGRSATGLFKADVGSTSFRWSMLQYALVL